MSFSATWWSPSPRSTRFGEKSCASCGRSTIFPGSHYVTPQDRLRRAIQSIREELAERLPELQSQRKLLEAQRLEQRTNFDIEMLQEMGYCTGIENYSRHLDGRQTRRTPLYPAGLLPQGCL